MVFEKLHRWLAIGWLLCVLSVSMFSGWRIAGGAPWLDTQIMSLLPGSERDPALNKVLRSAADNASQKMLLLVGHNNKEQAFAGARFLTEQLNAVATLESPASTEMLLQLGQFYQKFQGLLLSSDDYRRLQKQAFDALTQEVMTQLYNPMSGINSVQLANDPLLLHTRFLQQLSTGVRQLKQEHGWLWQQHENRFYVLLILTAKESVYQLSFQQRALEWISQAENELKQRSSAFSLDRTGALFYAEAGVESGQRDVSTVGLGSLLGIILLMLLIFNSLKPLLLSVISIVVGCVMGFATVLFSFGQVHMMTLVFGASLIGVSIDYAFHYFVHVNAGKSRLYTVRLIGVAVALGLISSVMAYLSLLWAPFPGMHQIALMSAVGLIAAFLTVMLWFPYVHWPRVGRITNRGIPWGLRLMQKLLGSIQRAPWRWRIGLMLFLGMAMAGYFRLSVSDDIRELQQLTPALKVQEEKIFAVTGIQSQQPLMLVMATSTQQLLQREEQLAEQLDRLVQQGQVNGYLNTARFVPSVQRQKDNQRLLSAALEQETLTKLANRIGANEALFQLYRTVVTQPKQYLTPEDLPWSLLSFIKPLWHGAIEPQRFVSFVLLFGVPSAFELGVIAANIDGVELVDQADEVSMVFARYRQHAAFLLSIAYVLTLALLLWRYAWRQALIMSMVPVSSVVCAVGMLAWLGLTFNLFALLAMVLVVGISIDYVIFFTEAKVEQAQKTLLAITLSALTTLMAFGLLSLSDTAAIATFGTVMLFGIGYGFMAATVLLATQADVLRKEKVTDL